MSSDIKQTNNEGLYHEYSPILYHVSDIINAQSITDNGIRRQKGKPFVSLSMSKISWFRDGMCLFEVNVEGVEHEMHTFLPELDEILVYGDIEKDRIKRII